MISEQICLDVVLSLYGRTTLVTRTFDLDDAKPPHAEVSEERNALSDNTLVRPLLMKYELSDVDAAIRWLYLGEYLTKTQFGARGPWLHVLTEKGISVATSGCFSADERKLFYLEEPYQVFLAHQFRPEDEEIEEYLRRNVLLPAGYSVVDGKAEGLEQFRSAILSKIHKARFFLCLLTHRSKLDTGGFASSVWLYQEIGAAIAMGKSPLLLVEDGMDPHYAGEMQKTYEYIPFARDSYKDLLDVVVTRFDADLQRHIIPLPARS